MRVRTRLSLNGFAGVVVVGITGVGSLIGVLGVSAAMGACSSNDSTTHGFVFTDSGTKGIGTFGDGGGVGRVMFSGDGSSNGDDDDAAGDGDAGDDDLGDDDSGDDLGGDDDSGQLDSGTRDAADGATAPAHVCDGVIGATEYGGGANNYSYASGQQTWYMDWDNTNLYVAVSDANVNEPLVLYLGENAQADAGNTFGFSTYDGTDPSTLPFPANVVAFAKGYAPGSPAYSEYRLANGTTWSSTSQLTPPITVCVVKGDAGGVTTREVVIPWTIDNNGGRPAGMKFLGYIETGNSSSPFIYGQVPTANPSGGGNAATAAATQYFSVVNTAADAGLAPFADPL